MPEKIDKRLVWKTAKGAIDDVTIVGVAGVAHPDHKAGIVVEDASLVLAELQQDGVPLEGAKLKKAATEFGIRHGLEVVEIPADKVRLLPTEVGAAPDRPPLAEVAEDDYKHAMGLIVPERTALVSSQIDDADEQLAETRKLQLATEKTTPEQDEPPPAGPTPAVTPPIEES